MKNKLLIFTKTGKIGQLVKANLSNVTAQTATTIEQMKNLLSAKDGNVLGIVVELTDEDGWRALEYIKLRLEIENKEFPIFAVVNSLQGVSNADSPFIEVDQKNTTESTLALEYGVSSVVLATPEYDNLMPSLESLDFIDNESTNDRFDLDNAGITLGRAWHEITIQLQRLNSELIQHRAKHKTDEMFATKESRGLSRIITQLESIKFNTKQ